MGSAEAIGFRLAKAREAQGMLQKDMAAAFGTTVKTYALSEAGKRPLSTDELSLLEGMGISIVWLLTGREQPSVENSQPVEPPADMPVHLDEELHARIVDGISRLYKDEGVGLSPMDLGRLAARIHADLVNALTDPDERRIGLKLALESLRRDLRKPVTPASSKRLA